MPADPTRLEIEAVLTSSGGVLYLSGELDADSATSLALEGERLVSEGRRALIIDCAGLTFCDSFGLKALTGISEMVQADGSVTIARPSDMLRRILEITGLADRFGVGVAPEAPLMEGV